MVDVSKLPKFQQAKAAKVGRDAILKYFDDPEYGEERTRWFNQVAEGASDKWHVLLALGFGVQITLYKKRPDPEFTRDFILYFVKNHMARADKPVLVH